ncbi:tRNA (N6-threonylcarbamoyladenosine(37)-N6)-methyltransferase TrmO [Glaciecola siphonariae]|uniref:tRNA (N6-threonylcarbamoyladenosine(37)-N6)-methyltransferase TrmO n=1 Tax=Glaciecola siphonariae TaxID=521012 RepID=A0ABV9LZW1_9ALTE
MSAEIKPVGHIFTPFTQKFGIPRQGAGLSIARGELVFEPEINAEEACAGIVEFSHLWLIFQFHQHADKPWSNKVRPPRLGGNNKIGVFASRSSFRPNGLGMSVVKLIDVGVRSLKVEGVDMISGTPIFDIKPYIAYADAIDNAKSAYAQDAPENTLAVKYTEQARLKLNALSQKYSDIVALIDAVVASDPRPAYKQKKADEKQYHVRIYDVDVLFTISATQASINDLIVVKPS